MLAFFPLNPLMLLLYIETVSVLPAGLPPLLPLLLTNLLTRGQSCALLSALSSPLIGLPIQTPSDRCLDLCPIWSVCRPLYCGFLYLTAVSHSVHLPHFTALFSISPSGQSSLLWHCRLLWDLELPYCAAETWQFIKCATSRNSHCS